jgi:hypothetical protein
MSERFSWREGLAATAVLLTAGAIVFELLCPSFRRWAVEHPVTVAALVGVLVAVIIVLALERVLDLAESRRWRAPALEAIEIYTHTTDQAREAITQRIVALAGGLASAPPAGASRADQLRAIAEQDRAGLPELADYSRQQVNATGALALQSYSILTRHEPAKAYIAEIGAVQRELVRLAENVVGLSFASGGLSGPDADRWRPQVERVAGEIEEGLRQVSDKLISMTLMVMRGSRCSDAAWREPSTAG